MLAKKDHTSLRDSIQQQGQALDESWVSVKGEANQLVLELQETYDDILRAFKDIVERRRDRQQKPVVRFVRHHPWVPLLVGAGTLTAFVIAARSR
jgi:hypothetical protein